MKTPRVGYCKEAFVSDGPRRVTGHPCSNRATTPDGYCRLHDPKERERRRAERGPTAFEREMEANKRALRDAFLAGAEAMRAKAMGACDVTSREPSINIYGANAARTRISAIDAEKLLP